MIAIGDDIRVVGGLADKLKVGGLVKLFKHHLLRGRRCDLARSGLATFRSG